MKKVLLICCLMIAGNALVFGQAATVSVVSKADFNTNVSRFNKLLDQNKEDAAKAAWTDVHNMMMAELDAIKTEMKSKAGDKAATQQYADKMRHQYEVYVSIVRAHAHMMQNKAQIRSKLDEFYKGML